MYINPYTGKKYKTLTEAKKAERGEDFPPKVTKKKFIKIIKEFKR